jgi:hypothetical protein
MTLEKPMSWITHWRDAAKRLRLGAKPYVMWVFSTPHPEFFGIRL